MYYTITLYALKVIQLSKVIRTATYMCSLDLMCAISIYVYSIPESYLSTINIMQDKIKWYLARYVHQCGNKGKI